MSCETPQDNDDLIVPFAEGLNFDFYSVDTEPPGPQPDNGRRIKLTWSVSHYNFNSTDGVRVRITASDAANMPSKIFAYQLLPMLPGANTRTGSFDHVCSPVDLEDYPEDEPLPKARPAWFRLNYVDVLVRSRAEVKAFLTDVADDVQRLKNTLDTMDTLLPGGSSWIGNPPPE
jgi:hypothetical protein